MAIFPRLVRMRIVGPSYRRKRKQLTGIVRNIKELVPKNANPDRKIPDCSHLRPVPATVMLPGRL